MKEPKNKCKKKCGLIMPISSIDSCSESHWEQVRTIIEEALEDTELSVELVSDSDDVGVIQKRIIQNIYDNDIVICDVSCKNPNVMFELGMRLAFDKPAVIIKDDITSYSFDTSPVEHLSYPRGLHYHQIQSFKEKLRSKVLATLEASKKSDYTTFLKHFGKFVVSNLEETKVGKDEYILESLNEVRRDIRMLRAENHESINRSLHPSRRMLDRMPSPEEYVETFLSQRNLKEEDLTNITNSSSDIFRELHRSYVDRVLSKFINVKGRHEHYAEKELLEALKNILPN